MTTTSVHIRQSVDADGVTSYVVELVTSATPVVTPSPARPCWGRRRYPHARDGARYGAHIKPRKESPS